MKVVAYRIIDDQYDCEYILKSSNNFNTYFKVYTIIDKYMDVKGNSDTLISIMICSEELLVIVVRMWSRT